MLTAYNIPDIHAHDTNISHLSPKINWNHYYYNKCIKCVCSTVYCSICWVFVCLFFFLDLSKFVFSRLSFKLLNYKRKQSILCECVIELWMFFSFLKSFSYVGVVVVLVWVRFVYCRIIVALTKVCLAYTQYYIVSIQEPISKKKKKKKNK